MKTKIHVLDVVLINGQCRCVYLDEYRIAGSKPYVSENPLYVSFKITTEDLKRAIQERRKK
jgi:hypothetical protein